MESHQRRKLTFSNSSSNTMKDSIKFILDPTISRISLAETRKRVQSLLQGNGVLLQAFELFLPDNSISSGVENNIPQFSESELLYERQFLLIVDMHKNLSEGLLVIFQMVQLSTNNSYFFSFVI